MKIQPKQIKYFDNNASLSWHVVQTKPRQELRAKENLQRQGFEVFMPLLEVEKIRHGKIQQVTEPLFKSYLFVQFDAQNSPWHTARYTLGVKQLLSFGGKLATVPATLIDTLKNNPRQQLQIYTAGDVLQVESGPLKGFEVIYQMTNGDDRALVLIELMNKTHAVQMAMDLLKKVS